MNGARSTYMRKGYLLTALAAAVLLAASSGTAWAQTIDTATKSITFDRSSASLKEGATTTRNPAATVKVTREARLDAEGRPMTLTAQTVELQLGDPMPMGSSDTGLTITAKGGDIEATGDARTITFTGDSSEVVLTISAVAVDGDWDDANYTLTLQRPDPDIALGTDEVVVTVADANAQPVASFTKASIKLVEDSTTNVAVKVGLAKGEKRPIPASLTGVTEDLLVVVDPPDILDDDPEAMGAANEDDGAISITMGANDDPLVPVTGKPGQYTLQAIGEFLDSSNAATALSLTITAAADMSDYKSSMITVSFESKSLMPPAGDITNGGSLSIYVESDEPIPTVSFSPTDVTIDEGGSTETVLIAEGALGSKVGMVTLSVKAGDALVGLYQGMDKLEANEDGNIVVDLGTSNSARLTANSYSDPDLNDGDTNFIAWEITDADGANIGDGYWFRVDVNGSTAVPALPLLGQLLLALFLMAGGARLYRRRQG